MGSGYCLLRDCTSGECGSGSIPTFWVKDFTSDTRTGFQGSRGSGTYAKTLRCTESGLTVDGRGDHHSLFRPSVASNLFFRWPCVIKRPSVGFRHIRTRNDLWSLDVDELLARSRVDADLSLVLVADFRHRWRQILHVAKLLRMISRGNRSDLGSCSASSRPLWMKPRVQRETLLTNELVSIPCAFGVEDKVPAMSRNCARDQNEIMVR